jgi:hypothetical protein
MENMYKNSPLSLSAKLAIFYLMNDNTHRFIKEIVVAEIVVNLR